MPLTEQQIAEGWLPHDGGPCPVDPESKPDVLFRGHTRPVESLSRMQGYAKYLRWGHNPLVPASDIIAYKIEENSRG